jgi:DNA-binding NarL/FixJ family response regulator
VSSEPVTPPRSRLALAPDAPLVVAGLVALMARTAPEVEVTTLGSAGADPGRVHMLMYDPQRHRLAAFEGVRRSSPQVLVIAFSWSTRPDVVDEARRDGAAAFMSKELADDEIATAIRALRAGHRGRFLIEPYTPAPTRGIRPRGLTERELHVLELVTEGCSNDEIAKRLFLSVNSVKSYIRTGYRKIGATRRSQAVLWGVENGLGPTHSTSG